MRFAFSCFLATAILAFGGCNQPTERLNAPPQGAASYPHEMQAAFVHMVDNAMLEDLSLADIHFVPHQAELNGLGARRLERYAKLLKVYGGAIRYSSKLEDPQLVAQRMDSIRAYLNTTEIRDERISVTRDMPGGEGMNAREAVAAKAATITPAGGTQSGGGGPMSALGSLFGGGK